MTGSGGRLHFGMVAGIKSERWPTSNRNPRPDCLGIRSQTRGLRLLQRLGSRLCPFFLGPFREIRDQRGELIRCCRTIDDCSDHAFGDRRRRRRRRREIERFAARIGPVLVRALTFCGCVENVGGDDIEQAPDFEFRLL